MSNPRWIKVWLVELQYPSGPIRVECASEQEARSEVNRIQEVLQQHQTDTLQLKCNGAVVTLPQLLTAQAVAETRDANRRSDR